MAPQTNRRPTKPSTIPPATSTATHALNSLPRNSDCQVPPTYSPKASAAITPKKLQKHADPQSDGNTTTVLPKTLKPCPLRCMSLNVEGLTGNLPYLLDCAKDYDFLFIQEHWLFSCNRNSISTAFPDYSNSIACTDNENPLSQHCLPRGWGGVAVLWKKSLNPFIRPVEVCSQRIVAVQLIKDSTSTLLVNVYMPSGNTPTKKAEYLSVTAQLKSLLDRFSSFHIVLAGDFNMDLNKQAYINDPRRIALVKLAEELSL